MATIKNLSYDTNGAHITSLDTETGDLFYLSSATERGAGAAIRGGIPLVAPWFGTMLGELQHGWARRAAWDITPNEDGFTGSYSQDGLVVGIDATTRENGLTVRLSIENSNQESTMVQLAFHPYFAVENVEETAVRGLGGLDLLDRVSGEQGKAPEDITFTGLVDAIADGTPEVQIVDKHRVITINSKGADCTVVWNPGEERAKSMEDIGVHEWNDFVCVEPALLGKDQKGILLSPGEIHTIEMDVNVTAAE